LKKKSGVVGISGISVIIQELGIFRNFYELKIMKKYQVVGISGIVRSF
jgi:hypothetical protein